MSRPFDFLALENAIERFADACYDVGYEHAKTGTRNTERVEAARETAETNLRAQIQEYLKRRTVGG